MEKKITKLNKLTAKHIGTRLAETVKPLADELGIAINLGNCVIGVNNCRFQLNVGLLDSAGQAITAEVDSFRYNAKAFGFDPDDLNKTFVFQGQTYTICGLKENNRRYPIIARAGNGRPINYLAGQFWLLWAEMYLTGSEMIHWIHLIL